MKTITARFLFVFLFVFSWGCDSDTEKPAPPLVYSSYITSFITRPTGIHIEYVKDRMTPTIGILMRGDKIICPSFEFSRLINYYGDTIFHNSAGLPVNNPVFGDSIKQISISYKTNEQSTFKPIKGNSKIKYRSYSEFIKNNYDVKYNRDKLESIEDFNLRLTKLMDTYFEVELEELNEKIHYNFRLEIFSFSNEYTLEFYL